MVGSLADRLWISGILGEVVGNCVFMAARPGLLSWIAVFRNLVGYDVDSDSGEAVRVYAADPHPCFEFI